MAQILLLGYCHGQGISGPCHCKSQRKLKEAYESQRWNSQGHAKVFEQEDPTGENKIDSLKGRACQRQEHASLQNFWTKKEYTAANYWARGISTHWISMFQAEEYQGGGASKSCTVFCSAKETDQTWEHAPSFPTLKTTPLLSHHLPLYTGKDMLQWWNTGFLQGPQWSYIFNSFTATKLSLFEDSSNADGYCPRYATLGIGEA